MEEVFQSTEPKVQRDWGKKKEREREGDLEDRFRTPNMTNISSKKRKKWGRSIN